MCSGSHRHLSHCSAAIDSVYLCCTWPAYLSFPGPARSLYIETKFYSWGRRLASKGVSGCNLPINIVSVLTSLSVWIILASLTDYTYTDRKVVCCQVAAVLQILFWFRRNSPEFPRDRKSLLLTRVRRKIFLSPALVCLREIPGWSCQ